MANDAEIHSRLLREKVSVEFKNNILFHTLFDCRKNSYTIKKNNYNPVRGRR